MPGSARAWLEAGLGLGAFLLPPLLAMVPHGAAPLVAFAGLCAAGLVAVSEPPHRFAALRWPALVLGSLLAWAAASAAWTIDPARSLMLDLRLAGLFTSTLALVAAVSRIATPSRLSLCLFAGTGLAIALAGCDLVTAGELSGYVTVRGFQPQRFNQLAVWLALISLPAGALLACRGRGLIALAITGGLIATVLLLADSAAKLGLVLGIIVSALLYWRHRAVARVAAVASVVAVLVAPITLPQFAELPGVMAIADSYKDSAGHRLLIWKFTGNRIAERPLAGWGLDASRAIPGGQQDIRPAQKWLPLHPHDAPLQVWLELGAVGAALFAALLGMLWLQLATARWPRLYAAAAGGTLASALAVALAGWGIWQEWWVATLSLALFAIMTMARAAVRSSAD